ncbi:hypothetical protein PAAG_02368 [Paracoccidioides lutzii Pb01]|uniref:Uncharacterized protein n=1 Tax=Paracoccidioides lutzii (strain ATCC MYA-826 / Pb01) TaxID=502779 RepID=C1GUP5_PARBA|nr:hypothetical protein PAAG_02368 [Paracoccidioides lutzii Pb01]EEH40313.2 hypothetical protein PAAG_02368 [Paracoccidioides lutzii Pb01]
MDLFSFFLQQIEVSDIHSQTFLEYYRPAILWCCIVFLIVKGIPVTRVRPDNAKASVKKTKKGVRWRKRKRGRIYNQYGVQILPVILEEEEEEMREENVSEMRGAVTSEFSSQNGNGIDIGDDISTTSNATDDASREQ